MQQLKEILNPEKIEDLNLTQTSKIPLLETEISEEELQKRMAWFLSRFFLVFTEVWDKTHKYRIDLVIIHKSDTEKKYPIGVEIKLVSKKRGKDLALWLKQASNYADQDFRPFGRCLIITCPQVSIWYLKEGELMHQHESSPDNNIATFLGQFNIGELQKYYQKEQKMARIVYKGQIIWDQHGDSFRTNNYERLCPK